MQRTLNYTGRKKIDRHEVTFSFPETNAEPPEFDVTFKLDTSQFPADGRLYVEAYNKETRQRFSFGTLEKITPPSSRILDELDLSGRVLFKVLIVDESGRRGLLLASGDGFRASGDDDENNKTCLMAVVTRPLGQKTWMVDFESGGKPELCINQNIPNAIERMKTDAVFQSLILPSAMREVLMYYLWNNAVETDDNDNAEQWMALAVFFGDKKPDSSDPRELTNWIDDVVDGFSAKFNFCDRLVDHLKECES